MKTRTGAKPARRPEIGPCAAAFCEIKDAAVQNAVKIDHIAIWADDLELLREFYEKYFGFASGDKYENPKKNFSSYFLSLGDGARIELMAGGPAKSAGGESAAGLAHFAISAGGRENVDVLTERLRRDGYRILGEPRTTGDGYYESAVSDPEGNRVEIKA